MSKAKECLKCKEIVTFCECGKSITDKDQYIVYLEQKVMSFAIELDYAQARCNHYIKHASDLHLLIMKY